MTLEVKSIIDDEIVISEFVDDDVYEYVNNIVSKYSIMSLVIYLKITVNDLIIEIKIYDNKPIE